MGNSEKEKIDFEWLDNKELHKRYANTCKTYKRKDFSYFPPAQMYAIPVSKMRTCLQDPILQLEVDGRKESTADTILKSYLPRLFEFITINALSCCQSSKNAFESSINTLSIIKKQYHDLGKGQFQSDLCTESNMNLNSLVCSQRIS